MKKEIVILSAGAVLFAAALLVPASFALPRFILFLLAFCISGAEVITGAVKGIMRGNIFNENTLMVTAAIGAFCIGEYAEAVFVVLFYRVGELFEDYAVTRSRRSISEVMNICPEYANRIEDGVVCRRDPEDVEIGDILLVGPGERVPLDGVVIDGSSFADTSALTGESVPRRVDAGDEILSGCINKNAALKIRVTKTFEDSTVSRILELVESASARKSTAERFITKFAKYYTPVVLVCALLLAVVPPLVLEGALFADYIYRALSFLVVSCPCALVISVPLAFFGGIGAAAKKGILIKGGNYLEVLSKTDTAVFDKTGTLTKGTFAVRQIHTEGMSEEELLFLAAHAESASLHPIAQSIREAYGREIDTSRIGTSEETAGYGIRTAVDGRTVLAGNAKLMAQIGLSCPVYGDGTHVYIAADGVYVGCIRIADVLKADAASGIASLKKAGIRETYMLTGDNRHTAESTAAEVGIDRVKSELLPDEKVAELEKILSSASGTTIYAGDGINDAPVLALADVGIAMGALGSDAAIEAADIVIMTDEIGKIETAIRTAKKTMGIAKQNIVFSVLIKVGILVLCSLNIVGMDIAVFGDVGVMVLAVLNSFRVLRN
ncbi:MAG: cadmium-translocating P-type ATPase [Ruminococcaceae bacterium]|nr:cadmium-translocating P-type ATPase [Oscillospiraceae bacterium]